MSGEPSDHGAAAPGSPGSTPHNDPSHQGRAPSADAAPHPHDPGGAPMGADVLGSEAQIRQLIAALQDENERLRAEVEAERDQHLRARADAENIRRRAEKEKADTAKYAIGKFAGDIVAVADNFDRAIKAVPAGATADDPALKALLEGVSMTEREFLSVLERHGVRRVSPQDQPFSPHLHQAVMEVENAAVPTGTCVQVFQHGYVIEDRVLRPAMVAVSRGGPKLQKTAEAEPPAGPAQGGPAQGMADPANDAAGDPGAQHGAGPESGDEAGDGRGPGGPA